jgi:hypothetical protein
MGRSMEVSSINQVYFNTDSQVGQGALARGVPPARALSFAGAPGAGSPSPGSVLCQTPGTCSPCLLDTCHQVGILRRAPVFNTPASVPAGVPGARQLFRPGLVVSLRAWVVRLNLSVVVVRISKLVSVKIVVLTLRFLRAANIVFALSALLGVVLSLSLSMRTS